MRWVANELGVPVAAVPFIAIIAGCAMGGGLWAMVLAGTILGVNTP